MKAKKSFPSLLINFSQFLLFFSICCLWNCKSDDGTSIDSFYQIDSTKKITIPLNPTSISSTRFLFSQHKVIDKIDYFFGYSWSQNQLEWFDLTNKKEAGKLKLSKEGPDGVPNLYSFYVHNLDSIFILGTRSIKLLNSKGEVLFSKAINFETKREKKDIDFSKYTIYNTPRNNSPIYYSGKNQMLYLAVKPNVPRFSKEKFNHPLCVSYNLEKDMFHFLPIKLPDKYFNKFFPLDKPCLSFSDKKIIYNFSFSSEIYVYDHSTQSSQVFSAESLLIPNSAPPLSENELYNDIASLRHISINSDFLPVRFSIPKEKYYRLAFAPISETEIRGKEGKKGKLLLSVFNAEFELLDETWLNGHLATGNTFIPSKGLLLFPKTSDENIFKLSLIQ